jgi:aldehyde:ferredoxin oxidoreductase
VAENYGYAGKILRVDLSSGSITRIPTQDYSDRFVGGRGVAAKIYWDEVSWDVGPFDPKNRLLFFREGQISQYIYSLRMAPSI